MALTAAERQALIGELVANCDCWKHSGDAQVLANFTDDKLVVLKSTMDASKRVATVLNAASTGFSPNGVDAYRLNPETNVWEHAKITANVAPATPAVPAPVVPGPVPAANTAPVSVPVVPTSTPVPGSPGATQAPVSPAPVQAPPTPQPPLNDLLPVPGSPTGATQPTPAIPPVGNGVVSPEELAALSPRIRAIVENSLNRDAHERRSLIENLLHNVAEGDARRTLLGVLEGKSVQELQALGLLKGAAPAAASYNYSASAVANGQPQLPPPEEDILPLPVMKWGTAS